MKKNYVEITGNVTKDVEGKTSTKGNRYVHFSVGVNEKYGDESNPTIRSMFFNISAFGKVVDNAENLKKGDFINIKGKLDVRRDEESRVSYTNIIAFEIEKVEKGSHSEVPEEMLTHIDECDEELPFK